MKIERTHEKPGEVEEREPVTVKEIAPEEDRRIRGRTLEEELDQLVLPWKKCYQLSLGGKVLLLYVRDNEFSTYLKRVTDVKTEDETTRLYEEARSLMQNETDRDQHAREYHFWTDSEKLTKWSDTKGRKIFDWSRGEIRSFPDGRKFSSFGKTFTPQLGRSGTSTT